MTTKRCDCFGKKIIELPLRATGKMDRLAPRKDIALRMDRAFVCPVSDNHLIMSSYENICCVTCNDYWRRSDVEN